MMITLNVETASVAETETVGAMLAEKITAEENLPRFVALFGDLGVGKTAFVRGFATVICPGAVIRSPTFSLVHEHRGKKTDLFHFDLYRITDEDDLYSIGFDDYLNRNGICLTEWSENIPFALPDRYIKVSIGKDAGRGPDFRFIRIEEIG